jgi:hypothetical protein
MLHSQALCVSREAAKQGPLVHGYFVIVAFGMKTRGVVNETHNSMLLPFPLRSEL